MKHDSPIVTGMDVSSLLPLLSHVDLEHVEVAQNERMTYYYVKSFLMTHGRDPNDRKLGDHIIFRIQS